MDENDTAFDLPEIPSNMPPAPKKTNTSQPTTPKPKDDDFDALAKRLEALKRK